MTKPRPPGPCWNACGGCGWLVMTSSSPPRPTNGRKIGTAVGRAVVHGQAQFGVVMCWTGTGTTMAANKVPGVRAALAWDPWIARGSREWNDANVLAMSLKRLSPDVVVEILDAFLSVDKPDESERENIAALEPVSDS